MVAIRRELQQGTPEWLEWRRAGIGASDMCPLLSLRYGTPYSLWKEKLGVANGHFVTESMLKGHDMEPIAREKFRDMFGFHVEPACFESFYNPLFRCSVDGVSADYKTVLEVKYMGSDNYQCVIQTGQPLSWHVPQLQYIMYVMELPTIFYCAINDAKECQIIEVEADKETQKKLVMAADAFWADNVIPRKPPAFTSKEIRDAEKMYRHEDDSLSTALMEYEELLEESKRLEDIIKEKKEAIVDMTGGRDTVCNGYKVQRIERKGNVQYKNIPQLFGVDLEQFRAAPTMYWTISIPKGE